MIKPKNGLTGLMLAAMTLSGTTLGAAERGSATHWVKAHDVYLRYELSGEGPDTVVLLHEMSTSLESWDYIAPALEHAHRVLRYDLRGWGLSERIHGPLTLEDEVEDLRGLLDALDIQGKVTLVGGAAGGAIALDFAAKYPARIVGVIAISPAAYMIPQLDRLPPPAPSSSSADTGTNGSQGASVTSTSPGGTGTSNTPGPLEAAYPLDLQRAHPDRLAHLLAMQSAADRSSMYPTVHAIYEIGFAAVLPHVSCPTLIVATSRWRRPVSDFKALADAAPKGSLVVIDTGHFAAIESPELILPVVTRFLRERSASAQ
jgi:3-oxoadipate enol-lactonase